MKEKEKKQLLWIIPGIISLLSLCVCLIKGDPQEFQEVFLLKSFRIFFGDPITWSVQVPSLSPLWNVPIIFLLSFLAIKFIYKNQENIKKDRDMSFSLLLLFGLVSGIIISILNLIMGTYLSNGMIILIVISFLVGLAMNFKVKHIFGFSLGIGSWTMFLLGVKHGLIVGASLGLIVAIICIIMIKAGGMVFPLIAKIKKKAEK